MQKLLADGVDPKQPAPSNERSISAASQPTPLNCSIIARALTSQHAQVLRLLPAAGAHVDATHIADGIIDSLPDYVLNRAVHELLQDATPRLRLELLRPAP
ncbi:MAG: hypothetical protein JNJ46_13630 [Myxococcales bacterium]|nr:hypothetical protein [Myxococcales bacterium]